jgi:hypothetical protein
VATVELAGRFEPLNAPLMIRRLYDTLSTTLDLISSQQPSTSPLLFT